MPHSRHNKQVGRDLVHNGNSPLEPLVVIYAHISAIKPHGASTGHIELLYELHYAALASTAGPDQCNYLQCQATTCIKKLSACKGKLQLQASQA